MSTYYHRLYDLKGKTAIVTGALGLLGKKFCEGLAEFGASTAIVDLDKQKTKEFASKLSDLYKVKCIGISCNVADIKSVNNMMSEAIDSFGEINILHNNAATKSDNLDAFFESFENYSLEEWRKIMSVNLDGMFLVAQAVGKQMIKQGIGGSIIQTSSIYGMLAPDKRIYKSSDYLNREINTPAVYSASKAGLLGLTKYLAAYWADKNIRVNSLIPGGIESGQNEIFQQKYSVRVPLGRMGKADELVAALIYLASDASSYVTGQNIIIDGGLSCW